jgi:dienelactone hydrolase
MKLRILSVFAGCVVFSSVQTSCIAAEKSPDIGESIAATDIWDLDELSQPPEMDWLDSESPIRSLTYEGESYRGDSTRVFAFYATPGTIRGDTSDDHDLPVVVLVHGGGGTAFAEWVWLWANRGYAAIAMDLSGRRPDAPRFEEGQLLVKHQVTRTRLKNGGPEHGHDEKFRSIGGEANDDWPYHAVANVIRAHSLIRSFDEVDANRSAITGISWGGYTTCITASVDYRFKAAVPVYGCGFLYDGESVQRQAIDALPPEKREEWIRRYDPSSHLSHCRVPILFVNGTNDPHYPLVSYSRSFHLVPGPKHLRIEVRMSHGHTAGWLPQEIGLFIDSVIKDGTPLPVLDVPGHKDRTVSVSYSATLRLKSAALHYTTDSGRLLDRKWKSVAATIDGTSVGTESLPDDAMIWFLSVTDERGAMVSSEIVFRADDGRE